MFRLSKRKIVAAIMAVLALLYISTLAIIYGSSYFEVSATNREMLERYAQLYSLENQPEEGLPPIHDGLSATDNLRKVPSKPFEQTMAFQLAAFYSVAISRNGEILAVDNNHETVYENTALQQYAAEIIEGKKSSGRKESLLYLTMEKGEYTLVAFMDNTIMQQSMTTLFRYTLVFGSIMIAVLFFVAVQLADRIVKPLEKSHEKQRRFISDAGHELKTPISVINANAELLSRELGANPWLDNIRYENERMGKLVSQLLELARTESVVVQTEILDFSRLVKGEVLPFESIAFEKDLVVQCDIMEGLFLEGSSNQLKQLVSILLDNAICHDQGGTEISLTLKADHGFAKLTVINKGTEIPLEQRANLFERFYRADSARNGEGDHYGLGLAIAKAVVTAHKGKINVRCYDGKVEFAAYLPLKNN